MEHWIYDNAIECPEFITKDTLIKYETKIKRSKGGGEGWKEGRSKYKWLFEEFYLRYVSNKNN